MGFCIVCNSPVTKHVDFGEFPIYAGTITEEHSDLDNVVYPFQVGLCNTCGAIQQIELPDQALLYKFFKNEGFGAKWKRHYESFKSFILSGIDTSGLRALEIGAGNGILANMLKNDMKLEVCDPNFKHTEGVVVHEGLFESTDFSGKYDVVYSSHVLEHVTQLDVHLNKVHGLLKDDGMMFVSLPNFRTWIENKYLNTFIQEHPFYPFLSDLTALFQNHGYVIDAVKEFEDHSLHIKAKKDPNPGLPVRQAAADSKRLLLDQFSGFLGELKNELSSITGDVFLFGAHIFSQIVLKFLPRNVNVIAILDNADAKNGQIQYGSTYLHGKKIYCQKPSVIAEHEQPRVFLRAGAYTSEIEKQLKAIHPGVQIL